MSPTQRHNSIRRAINIVDSYHVCGYVRRVEKLIKPNKIPSDIANLCLDFYHEFDYLAFCGENMEINENRDIATFGKGINAMMSRTGSSCYNDLEIKCTEPHLELIYRWKFKMTDGAEEKLEETACAATTAIGLIDDNKFRFLDHDEFYGGYIKKWFVAVCHNGFIYEGSTVKCWKKGAEFGIDDVFEILLDVSASYIEFAVNDKCCHKYKTTTLKANASLHVIIYSDKIQGSIKLMEFSKFSRRLITEHLDNGRGIETDGLKYCVNKFEKNISI